MRSQEEIDDRLRELRQVERSCDYYDPFLKRLSGEIIALEWVLAETEPKSYNHVPSAEDP
jgi:hypothetical protein